MAQIDSISYSICPRRIEDVAIALLNGNSHFLLAALIQFPDLCLLVIREFALPLWLDQLPQCKSACNFLTDFVLARLVGQEEHHRVAIQSDSFVVGAFVLEEDSNELRDGIDG